MKKINLEGLKESLYYGVCENGLKVYVWQNETVKTTYMTLSVKYGSLHTRFKVNNKIVTVPNGTAHFLEHIKFNESATTTAHDFFDKTGASTNAFTTFKYTSYLVTALDKINENLNHLFDFVQNPYFTNKMIQKEKGIIIEEANMGVDNYYTKHIFDLNRTLYRVSNYRNEITGNPSDIQKITLEDIKNVYNTFYTPDNMFLIVTGNVNPYEIFALVEENQKNKEQKKPINREVLFPKEPIKVNKSFMETEENISSPKGDVAFKIPRKLFLEYSDFELNNYLNLLLNINFDSTSNFKDDLLTNKLVTSLSSFAMIREDYIIIDTQFESKYPNEVIAKIEEKFNNLELSEEAFNRKLKVKVANLIIKFDDVEVVNDSIQSSIINYGDVIPDVKKKLENLNFKELVKIKEKLKLDNRVVLIQRPKNQHK